MSCRRYRLSCACLLVLSCCTLLPAAASPAEVSRHEPEVLEQARKKYMRSESGDMVAMEIGADGAGRVDAQPRPSSEDAEESQERLAMQIHADGQSQVALAEESDSAPPSDACCMREFRKYNPNEEVHGDPLMPKEFTRARIVFMCKKNRCPKKWISVPGQYCKTGFALGIEAGLKENRDVGFTDDAPCKEAEIRPDDRTEENEDSGLDYDKFETKHRKTCCVHTNNKDTRWTAVRFECKARGCWRKGGWLEAPGEHCESAFHAAEKAGLQTKKGDAFCKNFDGKTGA